MNTERMLQLAAKLDTVPSSHFAMKFTLSTRKNRHLRPLPWDTRSSIGTVSEFLAGEGNCGCIAAYALVLSDPDATLGFQSIMRRAQEWLELDDVQKDILFHGRFATRFYREGGGDAIGNVTPKQAARYIRTMVADELRSREMEQCGD